MAIFTAVTIAGGNWLRMAFQAMGLCIAAYLIPYFFVFHTALLMKGSLSSILTTSLTAAAGTLFLSTAVAGYFKKKASAPEHMLFAVGGGLLLHPGLITDGLGLLIVVCALASHLVLRATPTAAVESVK